jgi:hypothetical protein
MIWLLVFSLPAAPAGPLYASSLGFRTTSDLTRFFSSAIARTNTTTDLFQAANVDCGLPVPIPADADSWVDQNSPASNFALDGVLKVVSQSGGNARALIRFILPAIPDGCILGSARLYLKAASAATDRTLGVLSLSGPWTEDTVNWNNQPATAAPDIVITSAPVELTLERSASFRFTSNGGYFIWTILLYPALGMPVKAFHD